MCPMVPPLTQYTACHVKKHDLQSSLKVKLCFLQNVGALTDPLWCSFNKEEVLNIGMSPHNLSKGWKLGSHFHRLTRYTLQAITIMCSHMQSPCSSPPPNLKVMRVVHTVKPISIPCWGCRRLKDTTPLGCILIPAHRIMVSPGKIPLMSNTTYCPAWGALQKSSLI